MQTRRWIDNCIAEQSAWLHHKFDNTRGSDYAIGSDYARAGSTEMDAVEILEEHARGKDHVRAVSKELLGIAVVCQVGSKAVEICYGSVRHGCLTDDMMKSQAK